MTPFDPRQPLAIELEAAEWNLVMGGLVELQRHAGEVLGKINQQAQMAQRRGNGHAPTFTEPEMPADVR